MEINYVGHYHSSGLIHSHYYDLTKPATRKEYLSQETDNYEITRENLLHGYCDAFAVTLASKFGYQIEAIYDSNRLIHAYCKKSMYGKTYYIDARGITDNWEEFLSEFLISKNHTIGALREQPSYKKYDEFTCIMQKLIKQNEDEFSLNRILNNTQSKEDQEER